MTKYYHHSKAAYTHDCSKCEFEVCVEREDGFTVDIYYTCQDSNWPYLIRYSSEPGDYATVGIASLAIHYAEIMRGGLKL